MKLIGLMGAAGSGKSTAAQYLAESLYFQRLSFASPIKHMLSVGFGLPMQSLYGNTADKSKPQACFGGHSAREAMQTLGSEWGRTFWPEIWVHALERFIKSAHPADRIVIEDVRFANEVAMIRRMGGKIWLVRRTEVEERVGDHASEQYWRLADPDRTIANNDSVAKFHGQITYALENSP